METTQQVVDNLVQLAKATRPKPDPRALNAYRHGLTGHVRFFTTPEEEAAFNRHCDGYQASWTPVGAYEIDLCQMLADIAWRQKLAAAMENAMQAETLGHPVVRHCEHEQADVALEYSRIWKESGHQLDLLSRYERRLQRNFNETRKNLQDAQDRRRTAEKETQLAKAEAVRAAVVAKTRAAWQSAKPSPIAPKFDFSKKSDCPAIVSPHP